MTIDEAINILKSDNDYNKSIGCDTSYEEQLTEWLEDYKRIKQWKSDIMDSFCKYDVSSFEELVTNVRNKSIDDFVKEVKNLIVDLSVIRFKDIDEIAEELKAGRENE